METFLLSDPGDRAHDGFLQDRAAFLHGLQSYCGSLDVEEHASYPSATRAGEVLHRYSAFWPDRRIAPNGSVSPGTYVTTASDEPLVPSGLAAVARYALPNPAPAVYKYTIHPPVASRIRCGTCTPLYGQAGGGVEISLVNSLPAGSAYPPATIPER